MILKEAGGKIEGTYDMAGNVNGISGTQEGRKLTFTYTEPGDAEPGVSGNGEFVLATDGQSFEGKWGPSPDSLDQKWTGLRAAPCRAGIFGCMANELRLDAPAQTGEKVEGCYDFNGRATINGTAKENTPEGYLSRTGWNDRHSRMETGAGSGQLCGHLKPDTGTGGAWSGKRVEPQPGRIWLIILEARWERSLRDGEYSYGEMLRQFFTPCSGGCRAPPLFYRARDFAQWCTDLPYFAEPIVFYISSHGTEKGITVGREVLDGAFIGQHCDMHPR
jgi:hypothetical protein